MNVYWVYGHIVNTGSKCKYYIQAGHVLEAICKAYEIGGKFYTLDNVWNKDHSVLMADKIRIYNKV